LSRIGQIHSDLFLSLYCYMAQASGELFSTMSKIYDRLNRDLVAAGVPANIVREVKGCDLHTDGAINVLVNTGIDAAPYAHILLEYAPKLSDPVEIECVARCMTQPKGFRDAVPWLLSHFQKFPKNGLNDSHLWAIGLAIYTINDKRYYPDVINICRNKKYGGGRKMLMGTLARAKTDAAYDVLLQCVDDPSVRAHAIEGLGRFGCTDAIPILKALDVQKGLYEFKAKATALRRLRRKLDKET